MTIKRAHAALFCFSVFLNEKGESKDYCMGLIEITHNLKNREVKPPGGKMVYGEYITHTVCREFSEETAEKTPKGMKERFTISSPAFLQEVFREKGSDAYWWNVAYIIDGTDVTGSLEPGKTLIVEEVKHTFKLRQWGIWDFWCRLQFVYRERFFAALIEMMKYPDFQKRNKSIFAKIKVGMEKMRKQEEMQCAKA